jgi:hypothetical protein
MYVLTIAPLTDGIPHEELTYFSKESVEPGDLVEAPIKKRTIKGLVLQVTEAREQKQELRGAMFGIRKISKIGGERLAHVGASILLGYENAGEHDAVGMNMKTDSWEPCVVQIRLCGIIFCSKV